MLLSWFETEEVDVFGRLWFPDTEMPEADKPKNILKTLPVLQKIRACKESCISSCGLRTAVIH